MSQSPGAMKRGFAQAARRLTSIGVAPFALLGAASLPCPAPSAPGLAGLPSLCPVRFLLGIPCPGCGMTRAVVCCCHGAFGQAFTFHPLGPFVFAGLLLTVARQVPVIKRRLPILGAKGEDQFFAVGVAAILGVWIARLMHVLPSPPG